MSYNYLYSSDINLLVPDRISEGDAARQSLTAKAILEKLREQPGLILADEVGMGKTFVALAVAVSVYLRDKKPVVIMIPRNLIKKWPNDFELFKQACISDPRLRQTLKHGIAERPEKLLKYLDDDEKKRCAIIFLTHGALARNVSDGWIKLAIIQQALYRRRDTEDLYRSLGKYAGELIELLKYENKNKNVAIWQLLLEKNTNRWKKILKDNHFVDEEFDEPVPLKFKEELEKVSSIDLDALFQQLREQMPKRQSDKIKERLRIVRGILNREAKTIWTRCLAHVKLDLPLLIFDEAHHLKNSQTQLVTKLFHDPLAEEDAGILRGQFDRMLFLTATPFQLGHMELFNVLQRFNTINWKSPDAPDMSSLSYQEELKSLLTKLDESQIAAKKLDNSWGKLKSEDLVFEGLSFTNVYEWWKASRLDTSKLNAEILQLTEDFRIAKEKLTLVESSLTDHVIRHLKSKNLGVNYPGILRRNILAGNKIMNAVPLLPPSLQGLHISPDSMLPFLLAARLTTIRPDKRPVFAEGLASSFEAFRFTRDARLKKQQIAVTDNDDEILEADQVTDKVSFWYLDQLNESLNTVTSNGSHHPKIKPTVDKAMELWRKGEKVLVFCHYIATGKALRKYLSEAMRVSIRAKGSEILNCNPEDVFDNLDKIADKITGKETTLYKKCVEILDLQIDDFKELQNYRSDIIDVIIRYMRTPSFLIRFASPDHTDINEDWIDQSFATVDESGETLLSTIRTFLQFLNGRNEDREDYINDLKSIQPGGIRVKDMSASDLEEEEMSPDSDNTVMANVRLCYGATKPETRQKLMKTFNTPFFPDILITSNVMAEGVDLHLSCRHIIHHDLCWNPSTLEQRNGRVDRIGSKAEKCGLPIQVFLPFLTETQDEKMYKVVTERERWFNIIMGDKYKVDALSTDKYAERIPFPEELAKELSFNLEVKQA